VKQVRFLSRRAAADMQPQPGAVLISIHDRSEPPLTPRAGWAAVLVQRFHDTDGSLMGLEVFSNDQAREVLAFAQQHQDCPELTIHCQQGSSRSAALALFLSEKYGVPCYQEKRLVTRATWKFYNRMVYERTKLVDRNASD
jgi:predicted protein tyrosine phosphatase